MESVMSNTKTPKEEPRTETTPGKDDYNPVNMAGKGIDTAKNQPVEKASEKDDYNPLNMAGRTVESRSDQEPDDRRSKAD